MLNDNIIGLIWRLPLFTIANQNGFLEEGMLCLWEAGCHPV